MPDQTTELVRRSFGVTIRAVNVEERSVDVIASTDAIDSHGEWIEQSSWDLKRYEANPVVLYHHNISGYFDPPDPPYTLPIGHAENVRVTKTGLEATLFFVDDKASPMAEYVWQGFVQKSLRAISVGFRPHNVKSEKIEGRDVYKLSDCELFELSVCPMGSNPEAVAKAHDADRAQLKALASRGATSTEPPAQETKIMDEKQIQALKDEHTKAMEAERTKSNDLTAKLAVAEKSLVDAKSEAEAVSKALGAALAGQIEEKGVEPLHARAAACIARLGADAKAKGDQLIEKAVDALIPNQIDPSQKAEFVELAKSNHALFEKMVAKLVDRQLDKKVIQATDTKGPAMPAGASASDELAALAEAAE